MLAVLNTSDPNCGGSPRPDHTAGRAQLCPNPSKPLKNPPVPAATSDTFADQTAVVRHAQIRYEIARIQLKAGGIGEVMVLGDQIQSLQAAAERVQTEADRFADTAALFHAIGGGWWKTE